MSANFNVTWILLFLATGSTLITLDVCESSPNKVGPFETDFGARTILVPILAKGEIELIDLVIFAAVFNKVQTDKG